MRMKKFCWKVPGSEGYEAVSLVVICRQCGHHCIATCPKYTAADHCALSNRRIDVNVHREIPEWCELKNGTLADVKGAIV